LKKDFIHEAVFQIKHYLSNDGLCKQIAKNECAFVHINHSWDKMMKNIIDKIMRLDYAMILGEEM
jgi:hypothetical protein